MNKTLEHPPMLVTRPYEHELDYHAIESWFLAYGAPAPLPNFASAATGFIACIERAASQDGTAKQIFEDVGAFWMIADPKVGVCCLGPYVASPRLDIAERQAVLLKGFEHARALGSQLGCYKMVSAIGAEMASVLETRAEGYTVVRGHAYLLEVPTT